MIIDLHVHTRRYSGCSSIEAKDLIKAALAARIDGMILTEHGIIWDPLKLAPLGEEAEREGVLILAAQEVTSLHMGKRQDFIVLGLSESMGARGSAKDLVNEAHDRGGLVIAAHPFKPSRLGVGYHGAGEDIYELGVDAVELLHPSHDRAARDKVRQAAAALNIPMTGGSDAHEIYELGSYATRFLDHVQSMEDIIQAIRKKRIEPVNGDPRI
jgi:hypothetical protein